LEKARSDALPAARLTIFAFNPFLAEEWLMIDLDFIRRIASRGYRH
jgi:hypothetical protein